MVQRKVRRTKRPDIRQAHEIERARRHSLSRTIREEFPSVESIGIGLTFEDPDHLDDHNPESKQLKLSPDHKAFFEITCPYRECVRGGFDFGDAVRQAVQDQQTTAIGNVSCEGWQDMERIGSHRCWLKATSDIRIVYT